MNLLITGGLGGIGQELVRLASALPDVRVITVGRRALPPSLVLPANVLHEVGSIQDESFLKRVFEAHEVTHLVHAAGARTRDCESDPLLAVEANIHGAETTFRAARCVPTLKKAVHFSTAAVYGKQSEAITEAASMAPSSNYALTKAASELVVRGHVREASFQTTIVRPAFVIGRRSGGKLTTFVQGVVQPGPQALSFAPQFHLHWAPDLAEAILRLLQKPLSEKVDVLHLPGVDCALADFVAEVETAARARGALSEIRVHEDPEAKHPAHLDFSHFEEIVGRMPLTSLASMIHQMMDHEGADFGA